MLLNATSKPDCKHVCTIEANCQIFSRFGWYKDTIENSKKLKIFNINKGLQADAHSPSIRKYIYNEIAIEVVYCAKAAISSVLSALL